VTVENANAMMIFEFLNKFVALCLAYPTFNGKVSRTPNALTCTRR